MGSNLEPRESKTCPYCGAKMNVVTVGWDCPFCKVFVDMRGGVHLKDEKPFTMPPATIFDKVTADPATLAEYIAREVLGLEGARAAMSAAAWRKILMKVVEEV